MSHHEIPNALAYTKQVDFDAAVDAARSYMNSERFEGLERLHSPRQVAEQRGTIAQDYTVARESAAAFYTRLRELFDQKKSITTFGPYSPSQAVMMKRAGIEGIYLGGWATSAKGSKDEDPGADLASYPLSQVPDEASSIVRALLTADKNQQFRRFQMSEEERANTPAYDFRPFIIADADTGHGGDAHVRNLIRRFVEVGVTGYHIEDQKPGTKKCGHQGGKVLVACDEQIKRVNAARLQLDIMGVPGIIVARTDAEAANLMENISDERDQPFALGATNTDVPSYKVAVIAMQKVMSDLGATGMHGHKLYAISDDEMEFAVNWLKGSGMMSIITTQTKLMLQDHAHTTEKAFDAALNELVKIWEVAAGVKTYGQAVADRMQLLINEGMTFDMSVDEWETFAKTAPIKVAQTKALQLGLSLDWNIEMTRTPEGYYQIKGGIPTAIAKSLAVAPFADILWMETKTANLEEAKEFADAIHAVYPDKMLAYNLSPSFSWDTTGMTEEEMTAFPAEIGKLGFVFNFITYGGHQIDGLAADEFANSLIQDGMLALARIQRKFRLLDSPYKTPQSHVGGPRLDAALAATSGRTATTKAMGKGSTQFQHMVQTELPASVLAGWLKTWASTYDLKQQFDVKLRPHTPGSYILELSVESEGKQLANVVFTNGSDRNQTNILNVRDQNTFDTSLRQKRLMTLLHIFLVNRYKSDTIHYLTPTGDNHAQTQSMLNLGIFHKVQDEIGQIIVADVARDEVKSYISEEGKIEKLIKKQ